jgi:hypothetical protein
LTSAWSGFLFVLPLLVSRLKLQRFSLLSPSCFSPRTLACGAWYIWWSRKSLHLVMRYFSLTYCRA